MRLMLAGEGVGGISVWYCTLHLHKLHKRYVRPCDTSPDRSQAVEAIVAVHNSFL